MLMTFFLTTPFIPLLATVLYFMASGWLFIRLLKAAMGITIGKIGPLMTGGGAVLLHAFLLVHTLYLPDGLNLSLVNALSFTGWLIASVLVSFSLLWPLENLGIILFPFSGVTLLFAYLFPSRYILFTSDSWPLEIHVLLAILAYALLALAATQALVLALQDYRLHNRQPGGLLRGIPPLLTVEALLFQIIGIGFVVLSLALLSGLLFIEGLWTQAMLQKTFLSMIAWLVFGVLLWGRWRFGWRGRTAIFWTLSGFGTLMLAYFGSKWLFEVFLEHP